MFQCSEVKRKRSQAQSRARVATQAVSGGLQRRHVDGQARQMHLAVHNATHSTRGRSTAVLGALALGTQGCNPPRATYSNWLLLVLVVFGVECSFID